MDPNHGGRPSFPLKYTVGICMTMPQKTLGTALIQRKQDKGWGK